MQRRKQDGMETIPTIDFDQSLINDLQKQAYIGEDNKKLSVMRFGDQGRIIFVNEKNTIHILGVDTKYKAYSHGS